jgi:predicted transcriptional regulator
MTVLARVAERRRAAALARHYRDAEGLSIAEIARRLGRAEATVKAYLYDPTGEKAQVVRARYVGGRKGWLSWALRHTAVGATCSGRRPGHRSGRRSR